MVKRKLCDILKGTDVSINNALDPQKEVGIAEYGEETDENTLFILTKTAKGERRNASNIKPPYAVICERDDGSNAKNQARSRPAPRQEMLRSVHPATKR